jgi:dihydrofolate reductase
MKLNAIVAIDENNVIGSNNTLPWSMPADLAHFKQTTLNHAIIMGRKTYESIGRPLPGRENYVLTRNADLTIKGCHVINHITECPCDTAFLIGGAQLFEQYVTQIDTLYLTLIHHTFEGDTFFPPLNDTQWKTLNSTRHCADVNNAYDYTFKTLQQIPR